MNEGGGEVTEALEGGETAGGNAVREESGEGDVEAITFLFQNLMLCIYSQIIRIPLLLHHLHMRVVSIVCASLCLES